MNRREFIAFALAGASMPFAADAQAADRTYRLGWLDFSSSAENLGIFQQAMSARGWIDGKTFKLDYRGGEGKIEHLVAVANELVRLSVDVIVAPGAIEVLAAKKATASVPIVMSNVDDPVERGLIASLARPGANLTGLAGAGNEINGKLLLLLREIVPRASTVAVLSDSSDPTQRVVLTQIQRAAKAVGVSVSSVQVQSNTEVEPAFATIKKQGNRVLIVSPTPMLVPRWIADLSLKHGLALASTSAGYAYEGGLIAYTDDWNAVFDRVAVFVDKIFKGAKPSELPVELPAKFKLILNAMTAQRLGLTIPQSITVRADSVIQ